MRGRFDRDELLAAVDLRELAEELLGAGGPGGLSRTWRCPNPGHEQTGRTPPVTVFTGHRGGQRWRCHGCGAGGTAIDLVIACRPRSVREAMEFLAERSSGHGLASLIRDDRPPAAGQGSGAAVASDTGASSARERCEDPDGLRRYVGECAKRLWTPAGRALLCWLTEERRLPVAVIERNRIGADVGPRRQWRPHGIPRAEGVVLPVIDEGQVAYAQIRVLNPAVGRPRYLNPSRALASNPKVMRARPVEVLHDEVVVTEGAIDALSASAMGYRAVGVLSAAYSDAHVATALARLPHPLVIAFDADPAGKAAANTLVGLLGAHGRPPHVIDLGTGDLNDALRAGTLDLASARPASFLGAGRASPTANAVAL